MSIINLPGVALVTGASKGIGKATAVAFAAAGVRGLVLCSRTKADLEAVAEQAKQRATNPDFESLVVVCDISKEEDIVNLVEATVDKFGSLHYAVNNAGYIAQKFLPFAETTTERLDELALTNARGSFLCTREEIRAMLQQPLRTMTGLSGSTADIERGCIVNVGSVAALAAMQAAGSYVPTNWSRLGMTKAAAVDHAKDGIRVNSLLVGYTVTEGFLAHPDGTPELAEMLVKVNPSGRLASPEEAADCVVFLCSPLARYVNGASLVVDGGRTAVI